MARASVVGPSFRPASVHIIFSHAARQMNEHQLLRKGAYPPYLQTIFVVVVVVFQNFTLLFHIFFCFR